MKKNKTIAITTISSIILFGMLFSKEKILSPIKDEKNNRVVVESPSKEIASLISKQATLPEREQKTAVMAAFFNLKLDSLNDENQDALNTLEAAIRSGHKEAAPLIRDLLVDVAYKKIQIDEEYENQVNRLILIMEKEAPYEIEAMKKANPDSIALKYLETIKG